MSYSIQPHGKPGNFVLLLGHDNQHHGYNLCSLSDFDTNGEMTREAIVDGLNDKVRLEKENSTLLERLTRYDTLKAKTKGKDKAFTETLARQLHKRSSMQRFEDMTVEDQKRAVTDADDFLAMVFG